MSNKPYIKIQRSLFNHFLWNEKREFSKVEAWLDMIQMAAFKDEKVLVKDVAVYLKRGQCQGSLRYFVKRWGWKSTGKVSRFFDLLTGEQMITYKSVGVTNVITLINYNKLNEKETRAPFIPHTGPTDEAAPSIHGSELVGKIGKDAARLWVESDAENILSSKSPLALEWLQYRCEIGRPLRAHRELVDMVQGFQKNTSARLKKMMDYSIQRQYHTLYPDFDKRTQGTNKKGHDISKDRINAVEQILRG